MNKKPVKKRGASGEPKKGRPSIGFEIQSKKLIFKNQQTKTGMKRGRG